VKNCYYVRLVRPMDQPTNYWTDRKAWTLDPLSAFMVYDLGAAMMIKADAMAIGSGLVYGVELCTVGGGPVE
jgi:hypothetical protein